MQSVSQAVREILFTPSEMSANNLPEKHAETRSAVKRLQAELPKHFPLLNPEEMTSHHFCSGLYGRRMEMPAGSVVVGKLHAKQNFLVLLSGDVTIVTNDGPVRVQPPFFTITQPGDKRAIYAHTESVLMNFHPNPSDETDLNKLEELFITPEFDIIEV